MQREIHLPKIRDRIIDSEPGTIFINSDFKDITERKTIKMALSRLCDEKVLRRIRRGVYEYPKFNELLCEFVSPSPNKIAQAIARNYSWTIIPCGDTALNLLGLSTQVPNVWSYVSDGPYKTYELGKVFIKFKHTTNKEISGISYTIALVIQALKALGKYNISNKVIQKLSKVLSDEEKKILLIESKYVTSWIFEALREVTKEGVIHE